MPWVQVEDYKCKMAGVFTRRAPDLRPHPPRSGLVPEGYGRQPQVPIPATMDENELLNYAAFEDPEEAERLYEEGK